MDAVVWKGKCHVEVERVPIPRLEDDGDAIVRIELAGLCGSDLHPYCCREEGLDVGTIMGHEFVGRVVETGPGVSKFKPGDRVASPFTTCCGDCFYCLADLPCRCEKGQLLGWVQGGGGLHGAQAQYIRVPLADATLVKVPEGVSDEEALLLGDIFSTGFFCAHSAGIGGGAGGALATISAAAGGSTGGAQAAAAVGAAGAEKAPSEVVAVVGCGPVGLLAVIAARMLGVQTVYAIDSVPERLALAERLGARPVDRSTVDPVAALRAATGGRGADCVLEVVGAPSALRLAYDLVRPGGVISAVGCHTDPAFPFTPADLYNKNLTLKCGRCPARYYLERLLPLVQARALPADITSVVSHRLPLRAAPAAYKMFDRKQEGCTKVVFRPWEEAAG